VELLPGRRYGPISHIPDPACADPPSTITGTAARAVLLGIISNHSSRDAVLYAQPTMSTSGIADNC